IAVVAENGGTYRAGDKPDEEHRVRLEGAGHGVGLGKVELGKDQAGDDAVDEKVVPLNGGADGAGDDSAPQLLAVIGVGKGDRVDYSRGHRVFSSMLVVVSRRN